MVKAMIPLKYRDYCAHHFITYQKCRRSAGPFDVTKCDPEKHEWEHCQYEDFIMSGQTIGIFFVCRLLPSIAMNRIGNFR